MSLELEVSERYRSRDLRESKVFRKAVEIFGESSRSIVRKRLIIPVLNDSALEEDLPPNSLVNSVYAKPRTFPNKEKSSITDDVNETEVDEYHRWLKQRKEMRAQLERLDNVEKWLIGKECTPSERKLLESLQSHKTSSPSILDDETQVCSY